MIKMLLYHAELSPLRMESGVDATNIFFSQAAQAIEAGGCSYKL
jgi:hypothetical protein